MEKGTNIEKLKYDTQIKIENIKSKRFRYLAKALVGVAGCISVVLGAVMLNEPDVYWALILIIIAINYI